MSFIRATEKPEYSLAEKGLYLYISGDENKIIEGIGDLHNPEVFVEIMFRVLDNLVMKMISVLTHNDRRVLGKGKQTKRKRIRN